MIRDGEHGIYVPPSDSRVLRAAIEYLLTHPTKPSGWGELVAS